jgi:hypothetical protein
VLTQSYWLCWPTWLRNAMLVLLTAMAALGVLAGLSDFARSAGLLRDVGSIGMTLQQTEDMPAGWSEVAVLWRVGPAAAAGIKPGDLVRFDQPLGYAMQNRANLPLSLTVKRDASVLRKTIVIAPAIEGEGLQSEFALLGISLLVTLAFGGVLLVRGRKNNAAVLLGALLLMLGMANGRIMPWAPNLFVAQVWSIVLLPTFALISFFWPLFALEISGGAASRRQAIVVL